MKKWILVLGLMLATSSRGVTNAYLNYTAAQLNANLALVAAGHTSWDLAYGWGNHALGGYLTAESDPVWSAASSSVWTAIGSVSPGGYSAVSNAAISAYGWGNHATSGYLTASNEVAIYTAISNAAPADYEAVSNAALSAVQRVVLNGITNTGVTVNLGTVQTSVTNVQVYAPNDVSVVSVGGITVAGAGTNIANGTYALVSGDGMTAVYRQASATNMSISRDGGLNTWVLYNGLASLYRTPFGDTNTIPVSTWSTFGGPAPAPSSSVFYATSSVSASAASITALQSAVSSVSNTAATAYGWGNHATNSYLRAVTNVSINAAYGGVDVYAMVASEYTNGFILSGAVETHVNGSYTPDGAGYTNSATGTYFVHDAGEIWVIYEGTEQRYWQNNYYYDPWDPGGDWSSGGGAYTGLVFTAFASTNTWNLTNSLQYVSAPTGSVSTGSARQYSISGDTNRFFYWYSPTAVSGDTTGIWLRVEGQTF